jgi:hypothetical protein
MAKATSTGVSALKNLEHRENFKTLQLSNPNYFGNLAGSKLKAVLKITGDTAYEALTCVSYNPATQMLNAAFSVKQNGGYGGNPCTNGSTEYVRFYVDYDRNGTWVDEGFIGTNVHDLAFTTPLCYNVTMALNPSKKHCCDDKPVLPRVRAILSWNNVPPANQPNWIPVWGNHLEKDIQIAPLNSILCALKKGIKLDDATKLQLTANINLLDLPDLPNDPQAPSVQMLKALYKNEVEDSRILFKQVMAMKTDVAHAFNPAALQLPGVNWDSIVAQIAKLKFNTTYEELVCVALNREMDAVHGSVVIKRSGGYLGDLCKKGSKEYVAFYMDFGAGYQYMGTSYVRVHDITEINSIKGGLWYNVALPVNLQPHQLEYCKSGKAKLKGILSWNTPPPANQPNYVAAYGDWEECNVEVKSLLKGVTQGNTVMGLESVGSMPINKISTVSGLANGTNVGSTLTAQDSPFDYNVNVNGLLFFPGGNTYKYRIMMKKPGDAIFYPVTNAATVQTNTSGVISADINLTPDGAGWMDYLGIPGVRTVVNNYLGYVYPVVNGIHTIYVEVKNMVTNVVINSVQVPFMADKDAPVVDLVVTAGKCKSFPEDTVITGSFTATDAYSGSVSLAVFPADVPNGATLLFTSPAAGTSVLSYGVNLPGAGTSGTWTLDTTPMDPCGYVVRLEAVDRCIIASAYIGHRNYNDEGFCLVVK